MDTRICETEGCENRTASRGQGKYRRKCWTCLLKARGVSRASKNRSQVSRCRVGLKKRAVKKRAIIYLGGKCICPTCHLRPELVLPPEAFDFHHRVPTDKAYTISTLICRNRAWEVIRAELDKCDLLCCLCHRLHHHGGAGDD